MKVLFVASGNKNGKPGTVVYNQAQSLTKIGVEVEFFLIIGKGTIGYIKNIIPLVKYLKKSDAKIIHAHYSLSAFVAAIANRISIKRPIVVSLMGSDSMLSGLPRILVRFFHRFLWSVTIVKSKNMLDDLRIENVEVIPNGVDIDKIQAIEASVSESRSFAQNIVLFPADISRKSKNFPLAKKASELTNYELKVVYNISHDEVLRELLCSNILLLTSLWEGSPNIIKEAMACNCPIVATDVGDIKWLFGNESGHYISSFDPNDVAQKIEKALEFSNTIGRTNGRKRIVSLGLDSESVARKVLTIYHQLNQS